MSFPQKKHPYNNSPISTIGLNINGGGGIIPATDGSYQISPGITVLTDCVQITAQIKDPVEQEGTSSVAYDCCKDHVGYKTFWSGNKKYHLTFQKFIKGSPVLFEVKPKDKSRPFFRLKFNPSKLGADGIDTLKSIVDCMIYYGWQHLLKVGRITRIDIAVDVENISLDGLSICPNMPLKSTIYERSGLTGTIYLGSSKSPKQWRIYNKTMEQCEKGKQVDGPTIVRIERTIRTSVKMFNIVKLKNPFDDIAVGAFPACPNKVSEKHWAMFLDSCKLRGANSALALVSDKKTRSKYRKVLKNAKFDWWDSEDLLFKWLATFCNTGILSPQ